MTERKLSIKDRVRLGWEKIKLYPKIWVSSIAILCLLLGFMGGMSVGSYTSKTATDQRDGMQPADRPSFRGEGHQKMMPPDNNRSQNDNQESSSNNNDDSNASSSNESGFETETN